MHSKALRIALMRKEKLRILRTDSCKLIEIDNRLT